MFNGRLVPIMQIALLFVGLIALTNNAYPFEIEEKWDTDAGVVRMRIWITADNPQCIAANSCIRLSCDATGTILMSKIGTELFNINDEDLLDVKWNKEEQSLPSEYVPPKRVISTLTRVGSNDAGNYTCVTSWKGRNFSNTINLNVIDIARNETSIRVKVNDSVTLSCHNSPSILTHYSEFLTTPSKTTFVTETDDTMTLQLTNITRDMKGMYRCSVGGCPNLISDVIDLTVVDVPNVKINYVKAVGASKVCIKWTLDDGNDPVEKITVKCLDRGTEKFRYIDVVIREVSSMSRNYTVINDLEHGTSYGFEVVFTNSIGDSHPAHSEWVTTFNEDPDFIPKLTIEGATLDAIDIRASAPPSKLEDYVHYYEIKVTPEGGESEYHHWNYTESQYSIANLRSATGYRLQVAACNVYIHECGNWSNEEEVSTAGGENFIPTVTVEATTLDSITISWSKPTTARLYQIYDYKLEAINKNDTTIHKGPIHLDRTTNSYILVNLKSNTTYLLAVAACIYRSTECDDWSHAQTAITIDRDPRFVPIVEVGTITGDSIFISWAGPPPEFHDRVYQYKVMALHQNTPIRPVAYLAKDQRWYYFDNLKSLTTFQLQVAACSDYITQCGNWSAVKSAATMEQVEAVTSAVLWSSLAVAILLVIVMGVCMGRQKYRERAVRREFFEATLQRFNLGALNSMNSELDVSDQAELLPYNKKWEFPRELLVLDKILGSGEFGVVRKAEARSICRREKYTIVAVKLVRATARLHCMTALTRELKILANLGKHLNVVNLLGACTKNVPYGELFVIVEFCRFGNLHDYLFSHRANFVDKFATSVDRSCTAGSSRSCMDGLNSSDSGVGEVSQDADSLIDDQDQSQEPTDTEVESNDCPHTADLVESGLRSKYQGDYTDEDLRPVCTQDLLCWAWQVTRGMKYLGSKKILHGDLAARNVLLADHNVVKICDFGMARSLYMEENYWKKGHEPLPVKWMAIESLRDRVFSVQSDIWSFGILLWEFFTLAQTPYPGLIDPETLYQKLVDGFRMAKPKYATEHIHQMMLKCWDHEPSKRPSFDELAASIAELLDEDVKMHYMELSLPLEEENARAVEQGARDYLTMTPAELQSSIMVTITESRV